MVVAAALIGLISVVPFALGSLFVLGYISEAVQPPRQTDSMAGLFLVFGVPLMFVGGFVGLFGCLMLTRRLWSRVVYTVVIGFAVLIVLGFGVVYSVHMAVSDYEFEQAFQGGSPLWVHIISNLLSGAMQIAIPVGIPIASIVLIWRRQSRAFFTADPVPTGPPIINTGYPGFTATPAGLYYPGR